MHDISWFLDNSIFIYGGKASALPMMEEITIPPTTNFFKFSVKSSVLARYDKIVHVWRVLRGYLLVVHKFFLMQLLMSVFWEVLATDTI